MADSMEKDKEEQARKAHALAEKCFLAGNVLAARQWMQSAVRLAPDLPGTPQIVAAYDVHAAAAARSPTDWYAVLGLNPGGGGGVTHDDIKKQHRRLCLLVHPDKNPCAAADGAFMLVQAASRALLAKYPPPGTVAPAPPPPQQQRQAVPPTPRAPEPQPQPQPRPRRPQVVQMARRPAPPPTPRPAAPMPPTYSERAKQAEPVQKSRRRRGLSPPRPLFTSQIADKCPVCGVKVINGGESHFRCINCQWSPLDGRHDDDGYDFFDY
jgi:hypothetical protein